MPQPKGHYSQCIEYNKTLYLSGQLPVDPVSREIPPTVEGQTDLALHKIELILKEAGVTKNEIIQVKLYISDISLWEKVNNRYSLFFGEHKPARSIIPVGKLHYGCFIEIEVIAQSEI